MASLLRRRQLLPIAASAATLMILRPETVYAEQLPIPRKRSIYDDIPAQALPAPSKSESTQPTPTDRLASQIRIARLFINDKYSHLQHSLNLSLNHYLHLEHSVTDTLASLKPPRESGEQVLPGLVYTAVAAMSGSILTRRRVWPIRILTPAVVATGAAWWFIPITMRNISGLMWEWEKKVPMVAEKHLEARGKVEEGITEVRRAVEVSRMKVDEGVKEAREVVEGWVKKQ
ncbi:apolipo protein O-domain-containing protein [Tirmania nivea]|nr:apolipo protein O-domain-containing protein [Tirmania nivea]